MPVLDDYEHLKREHAALLASYGRVQARCSAMLNAQARRIEALQAETMQLRAEVIMRDTRLAWAGADRQALEAAVPGLARRVTLARQVEYLAGRVQSLVRARQAPTLAMPAVRVSRGTAGAAWTAAGLRAAGSPGAGSPGAGSPAAGSPAAGTPAAGSPAAGSLPVSKSVLCIGGDEGTTRLARVLAELSGARFLAIEGDGREHADRPRDPDAGATGVPRSPDAVRDDARAPSAEHDLEACLDAADLVICQTGCVSHGDFWRVQDHCKRHGKQCLLVDDPTALDDTRQVVRLHPARARSE
ncbi:DUF2325 domain-containing protein [Bordetella genomosp. 5]|uniref:DUF2325 domain-containing protein n=1 Tax=Bordetella genomosp. 5 TaxID=1395608 RepID=UPI000BD55678|nr:DUF2325 domain-containing protein [Bordetella genomosp. 5]OZI46113.1 DUF2325 domain-containing protein [Bordetella genomosp. 5]